MASSDYLLSAKILVFAALLVASAYCEEAEKAVESELSQSSSGEVKQNGDDDPVIPGLDNAELLEIYNSLERNRQNMMSSMMGLRTGGVPSANKLAAKVSASNAMKPVKQTQSSRRQLDEMRTLLTSSNNSPKRQMLLRMIADAVKSRSGNCPVSLPPEFCRQPLTFFLWLKEVRNQEKERELYDSVKNMLVHMFATPDQVSPAQKKAASA